MQDSLEYDYLFKYILVGDTSVGKTSILSWYNNNEFSNNSSPTMGVQFATKKVQIGDKIIKLQIWDTAGQESFRTITRAYYKNAIGVILVYDLTNPKSIQGLENSWLREIQQNSNDKAEIVVVGNKIDISAEQLLALPQNLSKFKRYLTSAKTGQNITKIFTELTETILSRIKRGQIKVDGNYGVRKGTFSRAKVQNITLQQPKKQIQNDSTCC